MPGWCVTKTVGVTGLGDDATLNVATTTILMLMDAASTSNPVTATPNLAMATAGVTADPALASVSAQAVIKLAVTVSALEGNESTIAFPGLVSPRHRGHLCCSRSRKARKIRLPCDVPWNVVD